MKGILIGIVLVLLFALVGWISFSNDDSTTTIQIDKQEIKDDTQEAARKTKQAAEEAARETQDALQKADEEISEEVEVEKRDPQVPESQAAP